MKLKKQFIMVKKKHCLQHKYEMMIDWKTADGNGINNKNIDGGEE